MAEAAAKDIILRPIDRATANAFVRRVHYSGKVALNSQVHLGVFLHGRLEGAMQFGPSLDKRKIQVLVDGTGWNEFLELNRMAFTDRLPRNSESRALGIAMRLLRKHAPQVRWVVTFADGTQCGDGTIYRAAGFVLTGINDFADMWRLPNGDSILGMTLRAHGYVEAIRPYISEPEFHQVRKGASNSRGVLRRIGAEPLPGHQLRYLYFLDPACRDRLTVPILPFSEIERRGAGMYRGQPRAGSIAADAPAVHAGEGGSIPTPALHRSAAD